MLELDRIGAMFTIKVEWQDAETAKVSLLPKTEEDRIITEEEIDKLISQSKEGGWDLFDVKTSKDPETKLAIEEMTMSSYRQ